VPYQLAPHEQASYLVVQVGMFQAEECAAIASIIQAGLLNNNNNFIEKFLNISIQTFFFTNVKYSCLHIFISIPPRLSYYFTGRMI
jgi:hypothetical protein